MGTLCAFDTESLNESRAFPWTSSQEKTSAEIRGEFSKKVLGEFCRGFFGGFLLGAFFLGKTRG